MYSFLKFYSSLQCTLPKKNPCVFVHGASGGVGSSLIKLLLGLKSIDSQWEGLRIIASCSTTPAMDYLKSLGVDWIVNRSDPKYMDTVKSLNDGKGPDIIYEMLANVNLNKDFVYYLCTPDL